MLDKQERERQRAAFEKAYVLRHEPYDTTFIYYEDANRYERPSVDEAWWMWQAAFAYVVEHAKLVAEVACTHVQGWTTRWIEKDGVRNIPPLGTLLCVFPSDGTPITNELVNKK